MGKVRYMISEAAKKLQVESHVLRYWEEELGLEIGRTDMGHRYYTEDDIQLFLCIQKLKNEGMLLRDLKYMIPELTAARKRLNSAKAEEGARRKEAGDKTNGTQPLYRLMEQAAEQMKCREQTAELLKYWMAGQTAELPKYRMTGQTAHRPKYRMAEQTAHRPKYRMAEQTAHRLKYRTAEQTANWMECGTADQVICKTA